VISCPRSSRIQEAFGASVFTRSLACMSLSRLTLVRCESIGIRKNTVLRFRARSGQIVCKFAFGLSRDL